MASLSEEKDLIGSILNGINNQLIPDDEISLISTVSQKRKQLSLKSKEFNPEQVINQDSFPTSNSSIISTGSASFQKWQIFFHTKIYIEIQSFYRQSQLSNPLNQTSDQEFFGSADKFQSAIDCGEKLQLKQKVKKYLKEQAKESQHKQFQLNSFQILDGNLLLSQKDLVNIIIKSSQEQICGNQLVNRKLQNVLDNNDQNQKQIIFCQIEKDCVKASKDMFGNYTVQKIFDVADYEQKYKLYSLLICHFLELSKNQYACRVVSKMIQFVKDSHELIESLIKTLYPLINQLLNDVNGNYVLLQCFEILDKSTLFFIIPLIEESIATLSKSTYGCRLIQKVLELYPLEITQRILDLLISFSYQLCNQEFGNYIIQFLLKCGPQKEKSQICQTIKENFEQLSCNKFGSNTVEKYLDLLGPSQIIKNLCKISNDQFVFYNLSIHPFGNYVMKKVLISEDPSVHYLKSLFKQHPDLILQLKNSEFGQRVAQILDTL
ncbi:unnamed protein product (macronuclear) [Paramecium tetraurelia]|uniref:PUM-HD domain-containing protein n=1 Tax=Paramecium tetraurelia TaxID=5888 RepID=A0D7I2_PARTE|nr:uncharacterized protein GSPATT00002041001 [Paramecium tetraurelia]CAK78999.1 unnamed protein product [Paramecium tetraurelia]|eukprot:XP_001446396.1 hypothetical protein (macronuclear) [Paramecium tetraurelia strain d4-2]